MAMATRVQTLGEAVSISQCADTFGKGTDPIILSMGK